jgi:hypothetical protein
MAFRKYQKVEREEVLPPKEGERLAKLAKALREVCLDCSKHPADCKCLQSS